MVSHQLFNNIPASFNLKDKQLLQFSILCNKIEEFQINFNSPFIKNAFGTNINIKFLCELDYNKNFKFKNNIVGICQIYIRDNEEEKIKEKNLNKSYKRVKEKNTDISLLGKKTIRIIRKQIYWINNSIFDENGRNYKWEAKFFIFKITFKKMKK